VHHNNFHLLRLAAAGQVAVIHVCDHFGFQNGLITLLGLFPGVPIFFVISGYLVSESLERTSLRQYAVNRALRIYPALWVCLVVSVFIALAHGVDFSGSFLWFVAQATIVQFYNPDFLRGFGIGVLNGNLWTIPVELQFYIALPFIYRLLPTTRALIAATIVFAAFSIVERMFGRGESLAEKLLTVTLAPYLYMFLIGVLLQKNRRFVSGYLTGRAVSWFALYVVVAFALWTAGAPVFGNDINPLCATFLALLVVAVAFARPLPLRHDLSYGLYLYHLPVLNIFVEHQRTSALDGLATILIALALAGLSWFLIERPALALKHSPMLRWLTAVQPG